MDKKELRSFIKTLKKQHSKESLLEQSQLILSKLESHRSFVEAETVMLYSSLPDDQLFCLLFSLPNRFDRSSKHRAHYLVEPLNIITPIST